MTASVPLSVHPMGRMIFIRCEGAPPTHETADAAANAWLEELAPPPLAERALAWERRYPLSIAIVERRELPGVDDLFLGKAGVEEVAAFRRATHAISVAGACDPTGDGWLAVGSYARGVARAFDGLVVDHLTYDLRPLDERTAPLAEVTLTEISGTMSIPMGPNRWLFMTHGLGNLGIPEVFFPEVPGTQVATAITVIQALREALATRAAAHVRAHGLEGSPSRRSRCRRSAP